MVEGDVVVLVEGVLVSVVLVVVVVVVVVLVVVVVDGGGGFLVSFVFRGGNAGGSVNVGAVTTPSCTISWTMLALFGCCC